MIELQGNPPVLLASEIRLTNWVACRFVAASMKKTFANMKVMDAKSSLVHQAIWRCGHPAAAGNVETIF